MLVMNTKYCNFCIVYTLRCIVRDPGHCRAMLFFFVFFLGGMRVFRVYVTLVRLAYTKPDLEPDRIESANKANANANLEQMPPARRQANSILTVTVRCVCQPSASPAYW